MELLRCEACCLRDDAEDGVGSKAPVLVLADLVSDAGVILAEVERVSVTLVGAWLFLAAVETAGRQPLGQPALHLLVVENLEDPDGLGLDGHALFFHHLRRCSTRIFPARHLDFEEFDSLGLLERRLVLYLGRDLFDELVDLLVGPIADFVRLHDEGTGGRHGLDDLVHLTIEGGFVFGLELKRRPGVH